MAELDRAEKSTLGGLRAVLTVAREVDPEMPAQTLLTMLEVAYDPDISMADLQQRMGLSSAAMSRIISRLSEWEKHEVPGLNYVVSRKAPTDRRFVLVTPTPRGLTFVRKLVAAATRKGA
jgi:DNA-binding MarR family transcriptional regulator